MKNQFLLIGIILGILSAFIIYDVVVIKLTYGIKLPKPAFFNFKELNKKLASQGYSCYLINSEKVDLFDYALTLKCFITSHSFDKAFSELNDILSIIFSDQKVKYVQIILYSPNKKLFSIGIAKKDFVYLQNNPEMFFNYLTPN